MKKYIAVTGGIGSGKSTIIEHIKRMGFPVFSCDDVYRQIFNDSDYIREIQECFSNVVVNGKINRSALRELVFSNKTAREKVDALAHPRIMATLFARMQDSAGDLVFAEVPLLFEGGFEKDFDGVIVVMRDLGLRIKAICDRDGGDSANAIKKINTQFDYESIENSQKIQTEVKIQIITNNAGVEDLYKQVEKAIKHFSSFATT